MAPRHAVSLFALRAHALHCFMLSTMLLRSKEKLVFRQSFRHPLPPIVIPSEARNPSSDGRVPSFCHLERSDRRERSRKISHPPIKRDSSTPMLRTSVQNDNLEDATHLRSEWHTPSSCAMLCNIIPRISALI